MRPYLAILTDSFRAALANKVLYILLLLITILLLAIAPFTMTESLDWELDSGSRQIEYDRVIERLVADGSEREAAVEAIWTRLPTSMQEQLQKYVTDGKKQTDFEAREKRNSDERRARTEFYGELCYELNQVIEDRDFYEASDWEGVQLPSEARGYLDESGLTEIRSRRLNRILVSVALQGAVPRGDASLLNFFYGPFEIGSAAISHQQVAQYIGENTPWIFDKFVMSLGLLIAIVVTANLVPETFDPGSLNLLLSKPISRAGLLISKFIGGCAFTTILATYLLLGTWLCFGFRLGVWENSILYSIPLYLLVFAIYYSVSTVAGIKYRSAILSVVLTAVFWGVCFMVGSVHGWLYNRLENTEISRIVQCEEKILAVDAFNSVFSWNEGASSWEQRASIFDPNSDSPEAFVFGFTSYLAPELEIPFVFSPVYDKATGTVFSAQMKGGPGRPLGCLVGDPADASFSFEKFGSFPSMALRLFSGPEGLMIVVRGGSIYRMKPDLVEALQNEETDKSKIQRLRELGGADLFEPTKWRLNVANGNRSAQIDFNQQKNEFAVYKRGELTLYGFDSELGYIRTASLEINTDFPKSMSCWLRAQQDSIVMVFGNGEVLHVDRETLKETRSFLPETRSKVKQVAMSRDGKWFAVCYANEKMWVFDVEKEEMRLASVGGQGAISGIGFNDKNEMWVADRTDRLRLYDLSSLEEKVEYSPTASYLKMAYRYIVRPVYLVFPKPSEVYKVVTHISSTQDTSYNRNVDLKNASSNSDPWSPLWSGLGFMVFMLCVGCVVFYYVDC